MKRYVYIFYAVLSIGLFTGSPVFSADIDDDDRNITGILVKVDLKNQIIYIKENSRIVKFKASPDKCEMFKGKLNMVVNITYEIGANKTLRIVTIVLSENQTGAAEVKDKVKPSLKKSPGSK